VHGADRGDVASRENRVEIGIGANQLRGRCPSIAFAWRRIGAKLLVGLQSGRTERPRISTPPLLHFGEARAAGADKRDPPPALSKQMRRRFEPALLVVRRDGRADLAFGRRAPAHEMGAALDQFLEPRPVLEIVAVAEQDDSVGLAAVLIIHVPVRRQLLEGDQQIIAAVGAAANHRPQERQVEGVDLAMVGQFLEEQQSERLRLLPAQPRGVLVDLVIELFGRGEYAPARCLADRRIAGERARNSGLRNPRDRRNVEGGRPPLRHRAASLSVLNTYV
jgi:hypothetical protein